MESRCQGPGSIESDCANAITALQSTGMNRSNILEPGY